MRKTIYLASLLLLTATDAFAIRIKERWTRDTTVGDAGILFSDTSVNNIDLIHRTGSQVRAYFMYSGSIHAALSNDNGITFSDEGERVAGNHFAALESNSGITIYYVGGDNPNNLLSASSSDGFTFTHDDGVRLTGTRGIIHPSIVTRPDGGFIMYYDEARTGKLPNFGKKIRSARSDDGVTWTEDSGVRIRTRTRGLPEEAGLIFSPFATYDVENEVYKLYFTVEASNSPRESGVYLALSRDGIKFTVQKGPVLRRDSSVPPQSSQYGLRGNPQDAFILVDGNQTERMYVWEAEVGYKSALLNRRRIQ